MRTIKGNQTTRPSRKTRVTAKWFSSKPCNGPSTLVQRMCVHSGTRFADTTSRPSSLHWRIQHTRRKEKALFARGEKERQTGHASQNTRVTAWWLTLRPRMASQYLSSTRVCIPEPATQHSLLHFVAASSYPARATKRVGTLRVEQEGRQDGACIPEDTGHGVAICLKVSDDLSTPAPHACVHPGARRCKHGLSPFVVASAYPARTTKREGAPRTGREGRQKL